MNKATARILEAVTLETCKKLANEGIERVKNHKTLVKRVNDLERKVKDLKQVATPEEKAT